MFNHSHTSHASHTTSRPSHAPTRVMRAAAVTAMTLGLVAGLMMPSPALAAADDAISGTPLTKDSTAELVVRGVEADSVSVAYRVIEMTLDADGTSPGAPPYVWAEPVREFVRAYDAEHNVDFIVDDAGDAGVSGDAALAGVVGDAYAGLPSDDDGEPADATAGQIADFADRLADFVGGSAGSGGGGGTGGTGGASLESYVGVTAGGAESGDGADGEADSGASATASATFAALPLGGYLVLTTGGRYIYRPVIANLAPRYRASDRQWVVADRFEAHAKRDVPSVDKSINEDRDDGHVTGKGVNGAGSDAVAIGDSVTFDLRADVPVFPNNATHRDFTVADTLSPGLTLEADTIEVFGVGGSGGAGGGGGDAETRLAADRYTLTLGGGQPAKPDDASSFSLRLDFGGTYYDGIRAYRAIHIRYRATVNSGVAIGPDGNPNTVTLEYSNNPYHDASHRIEHDRVIAYSYGLEILKTGGDGKPLAGAVFALGGDVDAVVGGSGQADAAADAETDSRGGDESITDESGSGTTGTAGANAAADESSNGSYEGVVPVGDGTAGGEVAGDAGVAGTGRYRLPYRDATGAIVAEDRERLTRDLAVSADGELWIDGLRPGTYTLTEMKAPDGYSPLGKPISFTITDVAVGGPGDDPAGGDVGGGGSDGGGEQPGGGTGGKSGVELTGNVVGQKTVGYAYGQIKNHRSWLPQTGSTGVIVLSAAGALMVLGGLALILRRRRS